MDSASLRAQQAPLKDQYKAEPGAARITLKAKGVVDEMSIACKVDTGRALAVAGLHPATGGSGMELCSGDMLLEALVACAGVTLKAVATAIDIKLDHAAVFAEGDLDFRGTLGVAKDAPVGFREIRPSFVLDADESRDRIDTLFEAHRALLRRLPDAQRPPGPFGLARPHLTHGLFSLRTNVAGCGHPAPRPQRARPHASARAPYLSIPHLLICLCAPLQLSWFCQVQTALKENAR